MAWVCNDCAEKDQDMYPFDGQLVRLREGEPPLSCEECWAMVTVLNKPRVIDDQCPWSQERFHDNWCDLRHDGLECNCSYEDLA